MPQTAKYLILVGAVLVLAGLVYWLLGSKLQWIGRLPGDIRMERENVRIYIPITTLLLASILLSLVLWLIRKLGG